MSNARPVIYASAIALLLVLWTAPVAVGEVRTGGHDNAFPAEIDGTPTAPELDRATVQYDSTAGSITATLRFTTPVADPTTTSALRPYTYGVSFGDFFGPGCTGTDATWFSLRGSLGDVAPGRLAYELNFDGSLDEVLPSLPVTEVFDSDRRTLTLQTAGPSLTRWNLICASAEIVNANVPGFAADSRTFGFLLDGFSRLDGALIREAASALTDDIEFLDRDLGPGKGPRTNLGISPNCKQAIRGVVSCSTTATLKSVQGRPRLKLSGQMRFPVPYRESGAETRWSHRMRGSLRWKRCPRRIDGLRRNRAGGCSHRITWRGGQSLSEAVLR